jgi:protein SCO1/2
MNTKALYAIMLAALIPLVSYFIVKNKSDKAIHMPGHYGYDTVINTVKRGKQVTDTQWRTLRDFSLKNQYGHPVNWETLKGKIVVADFFFTHCPSICPPMTRNMKMLQENINNGKRVGDRTNHNIHFLSFSVDPERDSVERLKYWQDRFQLNPEEWDLLTGEKKQIYDLAQQMLIGVKDGHGIDTSFVHSEMFVLIDTFRHIRGYYSGLDSLELRQLSHDVIMLTMEKDPNKRSFFEGKLTLIAVVMLVAIIGVGLLIFILKRKNATSGLDQQRS